SENEDFYPEEEMVTIDISLITQIVDFIQTNKPTKRWISVLIYSVLRQFNISFGEIDLFLSQLSLLTSNSCSQQLVNFKNKKITDLLVDCRGGKRKPCIFDYYPELEIEAKIYVDQQATKKECDFNLKDMAIFINDKYLELIGEIKTCETKETNHNLIRS
ncbi:hypothetical protein BpHYR1_019663, partial [Brachionus plicatilis]